VVCRPFAARLTVIEFAMFRELWWGQQTMTSAQLIDRIYHGSNGGAQVAPLHMAKRKLNEKIKPMGLQVTTVTRRNKALWRMEACAA